MKAIYRIFALALLVVVSACNKPEDIDLITVSTPEWSVGADGGKLIITVTSTSDWTVSKNVSWLTLSAKEGLTGESEFIIRTGENLSGDERTAVVTFSSAKSVATVTVTQTRNIVMDLESSEYVVDADGGTISVNLQSNLEYGIQIDGGDGWLTLADTKGVVEYTHCFNVEKNTLKEPRYATVSFTDSAENVTRSVTVYQRPRPDVLLMTFSGDALSSPCLEGSGTLALVEWGDGRHDSIRASETVSHEYERVADWNVKVSAIYMESFSIGSLKGISEIDLSDIVTDSIE